MKTWLFDLDGTLADTDPDIRLAWKAAMADLGLSAPSFDRDFVAGPPLEAMAEKLFPGVYTPELGARLRERFGFHYDNDGFPSTREYPGVIDAVRRIASSGDRVFIATNKRWIGARLMARHFGWDRIFAGIYTGDRWMDDPKIGKMDKTALLAFMLRDLGAAPGDCVMVGDTVNDFSAAAKNGIPSIAVAWGYGTAAERALADRVVQRPEELLR
ncbi:MAG: HAD hydrolase-like protein [Kiritimatiellae bacterium]|nr:HAD hydrolase-like protein [Kiritimatiellia bacterium]